MQDFLTPQRHEQAEDVCAVSLPIMPVCPSQHMPANLRTACSMAQAASLRKFDKDEDSKLHISKQHAIR